ncbi:MULTISPECIES: alpha/beta fold hydrolase [unclassified Bacillus (in: firmicutes)]|uniref:alpha/beta fold hydrolase n=1 Tax=unclassified Bacillus (in: firmicutes) TaxID=185979 RepID=UPI00080ACBD0|nr:MULTISPECIES: alpha/beta fold hydrolase [unclassified Bacillus (in: firmicutes)]OCA86934.1 carboxymethylenebutenolidase [Bacillus sp. FJAT-27986]
MKKIITISLSILLIIFVLGLTGFYFWSQQTYKASEEVTSYINLDDNQMKENWLVFEPIEKPKSGIILYPGAKVEPEAYSYYAQGLADKGYLVVVPKVNLNFALLDINQADLIIDEFSDITNWYVGGHSLGGVAAASYAYDHLEDVRGLILLGSYPSDSINFSETDLPILSLYAEFDGLTTTDKIADTKHLLSSEATLYEVKGGNHAQFGMYGTQDGDGKSTISAKEQQDEIIEETLKWLTQYQR